MKYQFSGARLRNQWKSLPMLRVLLPVACGILFSASLQLPVWFALAGMLCCGVGALLWKKSGWVVGLLLFLGITTSELHYGAAMPPRETPCYFLIETDQEPRIHERYTSASARLVAWSSDTLHWQGSEKRVTLYCDSTFQPRFGERLRLHGTLHPYAARHADYAALMYRRHHAGTLHLSERRVIGREPLPQGPSPAQRLHRLAVEHLQRLELRPENRAVVLAMAAGERSELTPTLRERYARSGTSHLLAVSGLHVGVFFFAVNLLLALLPLLHHGHRLKNLLAIVLIWLYALSTGGSPSVLRAALMFSALQLALAFSWSTRSLNTLCGVACILLVWEPDYLFDISFQLSFLAVAAILSWSLPLQGMVRQRWLRLPLGVLLMGGCATLATAPLVSLKFGIFSWVGLAINPPLIWLAQLLVPLCVGWMLLPVGALQGVASWSIDTVAGWQNRLVEAAAGWEHAASEVELSPGGTLLIYLVFVLFTVAACALERTDDKRSIG